MIYLHTVQYQINPFRVLRTFPEHAWSVQLPYVDQTRRQPISLRVPKDEQLSYQYRDQLPKQHRLASPLPRKHITN
jgi:hypothetical protein